MELLEQLITIADRNLDYTHRLVADISDDKLAAMPAPGMNHAAWVVGHIGLVNDFYSGLLGEPTKAPATWQTLLGGNSKPDADRSKYPSKAELIAFLDDAHKRMIAAVKSKPAAFWSQPPADEKRRARFPTMGLFLVHLLVNHTAVHLGQLSAWRRVQGLPSV